MNGTARWLATTFLLSLVPICRPVEAAAAAPAADGIHGLTAEQIIERNIAARGGAGAWQKIQTMAWTGHVESGADEFGKTPFLMLFQRPDSTRFEVMGKGQNSIRIFDGHKGWKLRSSPSGAPEVRDYNAEEISYASESYGLDGPLVDHAAKGVGVELGGMDQIDDRPAYRLKVTLPSGQIRTDWIDAQNFLELKCERQVRHPNGQMGMTTVYYRNYQTVNGLVMPFTIETGGGATSSANKMIIEKIALNPTLQASLFSKPATYSRPSGVTVDTTTAR